MYHREDGTNPDEDYVVYVDTDSLYASSIPLLKENEDRVKGTIDIARNMENRLNKFYDEFARRFFNVTKHRFKIKGESVAKSAIWLAKKRYALLRVYDLEKNKEIDDPKKQLKVKGLDTVRSSFPMAFRKFMEQILLDILTDIPKEDIDKKILDFKEEIKKKDISQITKNTAVNDISGYDLDTKKSKKSLLQFKTGTPAHVKAAITYNRLLTMFKARRSSPITDGDKVRWAYLKDNPLMISELAFKGYNDPKEVMDFLHEYIDYDKIFDSELKKKLENFYTALSWGKISTEINQNAGKFFSF
jgi:DNA polymerase elongation subunit (family B)